MSNYRVVYRIIGVQGVESCVRSRVVIGTSPLAASNLVQQSEAKKYLTRIADVEVMHVETVTEENSGE